MELASLKGAMKSKLVWLGALMLLLPEVLAIVEPVLGPVVGPEKWALVMQAAGVLVVVLRAVTTQSLADKAKPADEVKP